MDDADRQSRLNELAERLVGAKNLRGISVQLAGLRAAYVHPNRVLHYDDLVVALLFCFYNPTARSLRTIEGLSQSPQIMKHLSVDKICRSTFSDGMACFDPALLLPMIADLQAQIPDLRRKDNELCDIVRKILAADGSYFSIYNDVAWAILHTKRNGRKQAQIRLNLQIDVLDGVPRCLSVSGKAEGSETVAVAKLLEAGVIYLFDRNFVDFAIMKAVIERGSDFVIRARTDAPAFIAQRDLPLLEKDKEHGVISDRIGHLPGSASAAAPEQLIRELILTDPQTGKSIRVITTLLELPAYMIGLLYRQRWQIELFFRWLKCFANIEHLISHSRTGLTIQFYVAVIGVLLMYVRSGRRLSKYAYSLLGLVAMGMATLEGIMPILEQREREKDLERQRLARKKAAQKKV